MFDRHSLVSIYHETHFHIFHEAMRFGGATGSHEDRVDRWLASKTSQSAPPDRDRLLAVYRRYPADSAHLLRAVLEEDAEGAGKTRCGDKTPGMERLVPTLVRWYPDARFIGMVRDGRDVVRSLMKTPWATPNRAVLASHWSHSTRLLRRYAGRYPDRFRVVRYEDLLDDPRKVLIELDGFAGLAFEESQLDSSIAPRAFPTLDKKFHGNLGADVRASRGQAWKTEATPEEIADLNLIMGPELRMFGYGETEVRGVSVRRRLSSRAVKFSMNAARHPWVWPLTGPIRRVLKTLHLLPKSREERDSGS